MSEANDGSASSLAIASTAAAGGGEERSETWEPNTRGLSRFLSPSLFARMRVVTVAVPSNESYRHSLDHLSRSSPNAERGRF
ncbi:hypothetical protein [Halomicrococcus gelatinilyticus]|uniref:hypothetical protein n=1 Tax=Halomicrococcus gelatinilyticus TaxID=1702103 RepID=UPI002E13BA03